MAFAGPRQPSPAEIERLAREMGMGYRDDFVIYANPQPQSGPAANKNPPAGAQPGPGDAGATATAAETPALPGHSPASSPAGGESGNLIQPPASQGQVVTVVVPRGANLHQIAQMLYAQKLIADTGNFERLAQERDLSRRLIAGEYQVELPVSPEELVRILSGQELGQ